MSESSEWGNESFESLGKRAELNTGDTQAPAHLKAKIYSALLSAQSTTGPLASLTETKIMGRELCVFEEAVRILPVGARVKSLNFCRVCHARLLAESLTKAPVYWENCPYAEFHRS